MINCISIQSLSIEEWSAIVQAIGGILTLLIAYLAYRTFLRNEVRTKQLDVVCALINEIQTNLNLFHFNIDRRSNYHTIFDMITYPEFDKKGKLFFLFHNIEETVKWDFYKMYYSNPLLPKSIARIYL